MKLPIEERQDLTGKLGDDAVDEIQEGTVTAIHRPRNKIDKAWLRINDIRYPWQIKDCIYAPHIQVGSLIRYLHIDSTKTDTRKRGTYTFVEIISHKAPHRH